MLPNYLSAHVSTYKIDFSLQGQIFVISLEIRELPMKELRIHPEKWNTLYLRFINDECLNGDLQLPLPFLLSYRDEEWITTTYNPTNQIPPHQHYTSKRHNVRVPYLMFEKENEYLMFVLKYADSIG